MTKESKPVHADKRIKHKVTCMYCFHWDRWGKLYPTEAGQIQKMCREHGTKVTKDHAACEHFKLHKVFRCFAWGQLRTPKSCIKRYHDNPEEDCARCRQVDVLEDAVRLQLILGREGITDNHVPEKRTRPVLGGFLEDPSSNCNHIYEEGGFKYVNVVFCKYYCRARCETYLNRTHK